MSSQFFFARGDLAAANRAQRTLHGRRPVLERYLLYIFIHDKMRRENILLSIFIISTGRGATWKISRRLPVKRAAITRCLCFKWYASAALVSVDPRAPPSRRRRRENPTAERPHNTGAQRDDGRHNRHNYKNYNCEDDDYAILK